MIVVLTGGTGGAKFVDGLRSLAPPDELTIIVNTGDDHEWWGLNVSPDIDSITYVLAGKLSPERGWGVRRDTFHCLQEMKTLGEPAWFSVGDRDLAVHLLRTKLLRAGQTLSKATSVITERLGVSARVVPMSDDPVETRIETPAGEISFEEYFVQRRFQDEVKSVRFAGAENAKPASGVLESIASADAVLIAPSNPITSIGPILAIPGIRDALCQTSAPVVAVSPMVGNTAFSGPAAALMKAQGLESSVEGVAAAYQDVLDALIVHDSDRELGQKLGSDRLRVSATNIFMRSGEDKARIARTALSLAVPESVHASVE
jgi:LPPG:FO 2-phospho-L-lactate transferase